MKKKITLTKYKVGIGMFVLWALYFFSFYLAKGSPIFALLSDYASVAFGKIWLNVFFWLCMLVGILIMAKWYLMKTIIKQFFTFMVLVSWVLNFPIVDWEPIKYQEAWWYISRPLIALLQSVFWNQAIAVKVFVIILIIIVLARILYTFNFSLPKINVNFQKYDRPEKEEDIQEKEITKKIHQSIKKEDTERPQPQEVSRSFIKSLIKEKIKEKMETKKTIRPIISFSWDKPTFDVNLLDHTVWETTKIDETFLVEKSKALQNKLLEFGVPITIEWFDMWPSIVQIRIKPDSWIKISTIEWLSNDIKLSLKSKSLRIVAPIPWTDSVGIQLPNPKPAMVRVGDIIKSNEYQDVIKKSTTNLTLGKQIDGSITIKTLDSMPHLLVAWATWSWKSVGVNDFILSLMYQNTPSELKFLMVDPKQVELELYSWLPYMLWPIVSDSDQALKLLKRAVNEMEIRYGLLKEKRVKNIDEYNQKVIGEKMYRIVFVIDELADMMMTKNKKDVEICITRIAQKARAIGIHLIVATQRPSVNVITGLIKANIPTRIAFWVVSEIDSRTILGRKWAEDLVWKWDMLYMDPSTKFPIRIQAPFVSTEEIEKVVQALKDKYMKWLTEEEIYNPDIVAALESKVDSWSWYMWWWNSDDEELIQQAIQIIQQTRKASATLLQRKLWLWFPRAAKILDEIEERWLIGPQEWARPRDIFM